MLKHQRFGSRQQFVETMKEVYDPLYEVEIEYIVKVLRDCKYNKTLAAEVLEISRHTLLKKLRDRGYENLVNVPNREK